MALEGINSGGAGRGISYLPQWPVTTLIVA